VSEKSDWELGYQAGWREASAMPRAHEAGEYRRGWKDGHEVGKAEAENPKPVTHVHKSLGYDEGYAKAMAEVEPDLRELARLKKLVNELRARVRELTPPSEPLETVPPKVVDEGWASVTTSGSLVRCPDCGCTGGRHMRGCELS